MPFFKFNTTKHPKFVWISLEIKKEKVFFIMYNILFLNWSVEYSSHNVTCIYMHSNSANSPFSVCQCVVLIQIDGGIDRCGRVNFFYTHYNFSAKKTWNKKSGTIYMGRKLNSKASWSFLHVTDVSFLSSVGCVRRLFEKGLKQERRKKECCERGLVGALIWMHLHPCTHNEPFQRKYSYK